MRIHLAPSILSFDLSNLQSVVAQMDQAGAPILHIDVMDGQFVPPITIGDSYVKSLRAHSSALFEAHLMTETPERHFEPFRAAGCERILFHLEATQHPHRLAQSLRGMGVSPGIVLNPGTPVETAYPLLDVVDMVLIMTVNPGWGGQKFISSCLDKCRAIRDRVGDDFLIEVDGGVDRSTLPIAAAAGANVFVVGNHLKQAPDLGAEIRYMSGLVS